MTIATKLEPAVVNVRIKISALWGSMLFVFGYVDLFSLVEVAVLAGIVYAWTWPREVSPTSALA